jgi:hypothetical protein
MMTFLAETGHDSRYIQAYWRERQESAIQIAARIHNTAKALVEIDPVFGELWPYLQAQAILPGKDPGPILNMTEAELGDLIDKRCRFDKNPAAPEPPNEFGYSVLLGNNLMRSDPRGITLSINAGGTATDWYNVVTIGSDEWTGELLWQKERHLHNVLEILIQCWDPDLATIYGVFFDKSLPNQPAPPGRERMWMYWTRPNVEPHEMYKKMSPPEETRPWLDGTLSIWP